ncbi:MAG: AarF/ABC1/UbiB kinase family protein [Gemmatimonadetes bacterium]|nr:AarF/ABC1/UbiB kinase family protein [Gemmatimonadota bacterium]
MKRIARGFKIVLCMGPFVLAFLRDRKRWVVLGGPAKRTPQSHDRRAQRLVAAVASLGPTFIKLAQLLSARADIFPEPYLSAISTLHDQVPPDSSESIIRVIEEELGRKVDEAFDSFDRQPLAAASLGQVHRAVVGGQDVVVKVLRPNVEEIVALDLDISFGMLYWLNILFPNHHVQALTNVVREFSHKVREEMDFRMEADNIARFQQHFRDDPSVRAPNVFEAFTRRRVIVMEHCAGTKVDQLHDHFDSGRLNFNSFMENLTGLYLRMMMVDGFLHADPHPGNLLVQDDGTIVVLDWGMVLDVPRWTREAILGMALTVEAQNLDGMINGMYKLGMVSPEVSRGEIRDAATEIMRIMERVKTSNRDRIQEIVQELFDTFYTWPLMLPQELVYFFRASALIEGLGISYDRSFDGLGLLRRVVGDYKFQIAKTAAREPVAVAKDVLSDIQTTLRTVVDLLSRAEREELRVRVHPRDIQGQERFLHLQARRLLLSIFASATAVISSILFIAINNWWILAGGLLASLIMFVLVFFIPTHLLENPLRHARGIRPTHRLR